MNMKKILLSIFALATVAVAMVSCGDENYVEPGSADVSRNAEGVYIGELTTEDETAPLVGEGLTITVTCEDELTRANIVTLEGTVTNSSTGRDYDISDTKTFNTALANGSYVLTNPTNALSYGKITGDEIHYTLKLTPAGKMTAAGKYYTVVAKRRLLDE